MNPSERVDYASIHLAGGYESELEASSSSRALFGSSDKRIPEGFYQKDSTELLKKHAPNVLL